MMSIICLIFRCFFILYKKVKVKLKYEKKFHKSYSTFALMNLLNEILILKVTSQCHFINANITLKITVILD